VSRAIISKTFRDTRFVLLLAAIAVVLFEMLYIIAIHYFVRDVNAYVRALPSIGRQFVQRIAGTDAIEQLTLSGMMSIGYAHPFVFVVLWTFSIAYATRVIAGEVDRGTADLLLALPVRRAAVFVSLTLVWLACGVLLTAAPWLGTWLGQTLFNKGPFDLPRLAMVSANLFALYLAIGSGALMVSAMLSRRDQAVFIVASVLLVSYALNFLSEFWEPAKRVAFLGILEYYRPVPIMNTGQWSARDMCVLLSCAAVFWSIGLATFARRDIRTG